MVVDVSASMENRRGKVITPPSDLPSVLMGGSSDQHTLSCVSRRSTLPCVDFETVDSSACLVHGMAQGKP